MSVKQSALPAATTVVRLQRSIGHLGLLAEVTVQAIQVTIGANECLVLRRGHEISRLQRIPASRPLPPCDSDGFIGPDPRVL